MECIESIEINFNPDQLWMLNICLGFLMYGVALDLKLSNFKYLVDHPKLAFIGLSSQLILLPLLTLGLIFLFRPHPSVALGMILVASCPGGNVSNYAVHLAKGNSALSILLTSVSTLSAVFITPTYFMILSPFIPGVASLKEPISVSPYALVSTIITLIILPLIAGMLTNRYLPKLTKSIYKPIQNLSMLIFVGFIIAAVQSNSNVIFKCIHLIFLIVFIHNLSALALGYYWAKLNRLSTADARAISIETGIQNSGLGLILIFNFFEGSGGMALTTAFWAVWHLVSAFSLANWWRLKRNNPA